LPQVGPEAAPPPAWQSPTNRYTSRDTPVSDPTYTFAYGDQQVPAVARGRDGALVVWADNRNNVTNIFGTRLDDSGHVLDPQGIDFTPDSRHFQGTPDVAWNGVDYLVVWSDDRSTNANDIYGALITPSGSVVSRFPVSTAPGWQANPVVAWDGSTFLVAWDSFDPQRAASPQDVYAARVASNGTVLDPSGIPIATNSAQQAAPSVSSDGSSFFVVWQDEGLGGGFDILGARIEADGTDQDPSGVHVGVAARDQEYASIAWSGSEYLVGWADGRTWPNNSIFAARVTSDAHVLDPAGLELATTQRSQGSVDVAWDGSDFLVAWGRDVDGSTNTDLYGTRITSSGVVLDPGGRQWTSSPQLEAYPAMVRLGSNVWMAWQDRRNGSAAGYRQWDVYGEDIAQDGSASGEELVTSQPTPQKNPAIAWNGSEYLVAWLDFRSADTYGDLYIGRIGAAGEILDGTGILVSEGNAFRGPPRIASDGSDFLLTWSEGNPNRVLATRVAASGAILDPGGFSVSDPSTFSGSPAVAWDGSAYTVVWDAWNGSSDDIYGARVTTEGIVIDDPPFAVADGSWAEYSPGIAWNGSNFLVTWADSRSSDDHIYGARVSPYGIVLDAGGFQISHGPGEWADSVASGGGEYLVDWFNVDYNVRAARVDAEGTVLDNALGISMRSGFDPAVGWDGTNFVAAWAGEGYSSDDLLTERIGLDGHILDPGGIVDWSSRVNEWAPAVTGGPAGRVAIAFQRSNGAAGSSLIYARFLDENSPGRKAPPP